VVLAGGLGTRMRPFTESLPKSMLTIDGRPFVHYQLDWLAAERATNVIFCVGYRGNLIREYVGDGSRWGIETAYVDEGDRLLGTAGGLRLAYDQGVLDSNFAVLYGDSFLRVSLRDMWARFLAGGNFALMAVLRNEGRWDRSNVVFCDGQVALYDKNASEPQPPSMRYIDYGVSILQRAVIEREVPPRQHSDLAPVLNKLSVEGRLGGFEATERFFEIGSPEGLRDFEEYIISTRCRS
jgi:prepilin-type processing-associated H-X9-DG protein